MTASLPYRYSEREPSPAIAHCILSLWAFEADAAPPPSEPYTVFPDGCTSVGFFRGSLGPVRMVMTGPSVAAIRPAVFAGQRLYGFRVWPDTTEAVLGMSPKELRGFMGPVPGRIAGRFGDIHGPVQHAADTPSALACIDRELVARLSGCAAPEPRVRAAIKAIVAARGEIAMPDVAREAGVGLRQLQRQFPLATGLTLREYARVRRLREALGQRLATNPAGWSRIAAESGYVDQAHLTREFVALTGVRPTHAASQIARTVHDGVRP